MTGSTSLDNAKAEGMKPVGFDTYSQCVDKVLDGTVEAMTTDGTILPATPRRTRASSRSSATRSPRSASASATRRTPGDVPVDRRHARPLPTRTATGPRPSRPTWALRVSRRPSSPRWTPARPEHLVHRLSRGPLSTAGPEAQAPPLREERRGSLLQRVPRGPAGVRLHRSALPGRRGCSHSSAARSSSRCGSGPIAVLSKAAATYVTLVRNTPLLMIFFFFQFAAPKIGINFKCVDVHIGSFDFTSFFSTRRASR